MQRRVGPTRGSKIVIGAFVGVFQAYDPESNVVVARFQSGALFVSWALCGVWQKAQVLFIESSVAPETAFMSWNEPLIPVCATIPAYAAPDIRPVNAIATVSFFNMVILLFRFFAPYVVLK
jgi:hypothetical protein